MPDNPIYVKCADCRRRQRRAYHQHLRQRAEHLVKTYDPKASYKDWMGCRGMKPKEALAHVQEELRQQKTGWGVYRYLGHNCRKLGC